MHADIFSDFFNILKFVSLIQGAYAPVIKCAFPMYMLRFEAYMSLLVKDRDVV
jgi:hypothetical protein